MSCRMLTQGDLSATVIDDGTLILVQTVWKRTLLRNTSNITLYLKYTRFTSAVRNHLYIAETEATAVLDHP